MCLQLLQAHTEAPFRITADIWWQTINMNCQNLFPRKTKNKFQGTMLFSWRIISTLKHFSWNSISLDHIGRKRLTELLLIISVFINVITDEYLFLAY